MHKSTVVLPVVSLLFGSLSAVVLSAQEMEMPKPAPILARFEPLIGVWTGKGVARQSADAKSGTEPWTATMSIQRILGGFAVQEDLVIEMGAPTPFLMRTVYGFDASSGHAMAVIVSNVGQANRMGYEFHGDGILVTYGIDPAHDESGTGIGRSRIEFTKDSYRFVHDGMRGAGRPFVEVEGEFTKPAGGGAVKAVDVAFANQPAGEEMKSLAAFFGKYAVAGKMMMAPGQPMVDITGTDAYQPMYGGLIALETVEGESGPEMPKYVSHSYGAWNPVTSCYDWFVFDNMGVAMSMASRWSKPGTQMVFAGSMVSMGTLVSSNTVMNLGQNGITSAKGHTLWGAEDPVVSFDARFTRR